MTKFALAVASAFLLSTAAAFAAAPAAKDQHSSMAHKTMAHKTMVHKTMVHKTMAHKATAHKAMAHKAWPAHKSQKAAMHKTAWHTSSGAAGAREVHALNLLEAAGYRSITGLHPQGRNIKASAERSGKNERLTVTPSGRILPSA